MVSALVTFAVTRLGISITMPLDRNHRSVSIVFRQLPPCLIVALVLCTLRLFLFSQEGRWGGRQRLLVQRIF